MNLFLNYCYEFELRDVLRKLKAEKCITSLLWRVPSSPTDEPAFIHDARFACIKNKLEGESFLTFEQLETLASLDIQECIFHGNSNIDVFLHPVNEHDAALTINLFDYHSITFISKNDNIIGKILDHFPLVEIFEKPADL